MVIETLLTALTGGATGLIGSLIGRVAGYFEEKQKLKRLEVELAHEVVLQKMQQQENALEREQEKYITGVEAQTTSLVSSYAHDSSFGDSALRWVRPLLTLLLIVGTVLVYYTLPDQLTKSDVALQIVYFTGVAISWWFADRSGRKR